jgi:uncharacterized protein (TIGR02147 family)
MKKRRANKLNVFEYDDYRAFLKDKFAERKRLGKFFSHRYFAKKAGFKTPSLLQMVVRGKRNLTLESIKKFIKGFELSSREAKYFEMMVLFNQTPALAEKRQYYEQMLNIKKMAIGKKLARGQYEYYSHWYLPVIREMASLPGFRPDPAWIQQRLREKVSLPDLRKAVGLLRELKMIEETPEGNWRASEPILTTGPQSESVHVANKEICAMTREFKQRLIEKIVNDKPSEQVYQLNFHLFPFLKKSPE